ncbi:SixA phosphatase family protein [Thioalkalivibrio sp.]|uniref:SixA phosphatase family protein n=1 Tax=Thioalkalivibrio sp. TaxID=2093813 RepID=UPI003568E88E
MKKTAPAPDTRLLVLVRHAQAGDAERFWQETGRPDRERPLTGEGRKRNEAAASGLSRLVARVDHLWSSPYTRAWQTAQGIAEVFGRPAEAPDPLEPPWRLQTLSDWLESQVARGETAILVGHEPDLSTLLGKWLCGAGGRAPVPMEKGAACALQVSGRIAPGTLELVWKLPQYGLRRL